MLKNIKDYSFQSCDEYLCFHLGEKKEEKNCQFLQENGLINIQET